jgi:PAS domain S-box-containing protein
LSTKEALGALLDDRQSQLLLDAVRDYAIYMLDAGGRVATWSGSAARVKGYAGYEILGQHFSCFFTPEDVAAGVPGQILAAATEHGRHETEGWRVRKDGSRFWALAAISAVRDESGRLIGFAKVTRDMTDRKRVQDALLESERRFRLLVEGVADYAIYMLDPSGVVTNWNLGAKRIKGYEADEIIGRHFSTFYTKEDREGGLPIRALTAAREQGRYEAEGWRVRKDGSRFWASVVIDAIRGEDGELIGFAKITRDITERRAAQEALQESERQFRTLVGGVTDHALFMLDPNGVVTNWNVGGERIKGYKASEIVGQHFSRFYTDADRWAGVPARALATASEEGKYEAEGWRVRKDGSLFWASVVIDAIRAEDGRLLGFAKITRDVTERREAQLKLDQAQAQLAQSQKLEALGQLTGGVAHDFNNLLMIVSGHAQLLKTRIADNPKALQSVAAIEAATQRGEALTRQLLSFARRQRLEPTAIDLSERLAAFRQLLANAVRKDVKLVIDAPSQVWPVRADANELELALVNLAVNGRDAMPEGGTLTIGARNTSLAAGEVRDVPQGDFVAVSVTDTGVGIPADILSKVFEPFFTTKAVDKGTGLGLSQVYGFAHQSGGGVTISSELGKGACITLYLPRAVEGQEQAQIEAASEPEARRGGSVLVVEDNPEVASISAELLSQLGYVVRVAGNAEAALQILAEDGPVDVVISDIVMAGAMDGLALARHLHEVHPDLPVLLVSGYSKAAEAGRQEFPLLRKPYQMPELARAVSRLIRDAREPPNGGNLVRLGEERRRRRRDKTS